jgi:hypothetical protein
MSSIIAAIASFEQLQHTKLLVLAMFFYVFLPVIEDAPQDARTFVFLQSEMTIAQFAELVLPIQQDNGWLVHRNDRVSYWHGYAGDLEALGTPVGFNCFNCQAYK